MKRGKTETRIEAKKKSNQRKKPIRKRKQDMKEGPEKEKGRMQTP